MVPLTSEEINGLLNDDLAMTTTALKAHPKDTKNVLMRSVMSVSFLIKQSRTHFLGIEKLGATPAQVWLC